MVRAGARCCLGMVVLLALPGGARAAPGHVTLPAHVAGVAAMPVSETPIEGLNEIFHMETTRLVFLGAGILSGLVFIAPTLEAGEIFGVVLGIIGSECLYRLYVNAPPAHGAAPAPASPPPRNAAPPRPTARHGAG